MAAEKKSFLKKIAKFIGIVDDPESYTEENDVALDDDRGMPAYASRREKYTITPETASDAESTPRRQRPQETTSRFSAPAPRTSAPSGQRMQSRTNTARRPSAALDYDRDRSRANDPRNARPQRRSMPVPNETIMASAGSIEETRPLINALVRGFTIVLTIDAADDTMNRRILDTFCGAVFALKATIRSAPGSYNTYVIAPRSTALRSWEELTDNMR